MPNPGSRTLRCTALAGGGALVVLGAARRSLPPLVGGALLVAAGAWPGRPWARSLHLSAAVTIRRPRADVYAHWRQLETLPGFMRHLESVTVEDERRSRWVARAPHDAARVEWQAEIVDEEPDAWLAWRSLPGADVANAGSVRFEDAPGGGTEIHVSLNYEPPAGPAGRAAAKVLSPVSSRVLEQDLRRLKSLLETGEIPTVEGQPDGRRD